MKKNTNSYFHRLLNILKQKNSKPILITVSAALSIGLVFGFLMLQMVHQDKEQTTYHVYATTETSQNQEEQIAIDLPELQLFVHQGGVYSSKENTEQLSKQLTEEEIPFTVREMDEQYFVWMNLQLTKAEMEKQADKMDKLGIDVYVKEWDLPAATVYVEEQTASWIETYTSIVEQTLKDNGTIQQKHVEALISEDDMPEQVQTWQKQLKKIIHDSNSKEQQFIKFVVQYERIMNDIKE